MIEGKCGGLLLVCCHRGDDQLDTGATVETDMMASGPWQAGNVDCLIVTGGSVLRTGSRWRQQKGLMRFPRIGDPRIQ